MVKLPWPSPSNEYFAWELQKWKLFPVPLPTHIFQRKCIKDFCLFLNTQLVGNMTSPTAPCQPARASTAAQGAPSPLTPTEDLVRHPEHHELQLQDPHPTSVSADSGRPDVPCPPTPALTFLFFRQLFGLVPNFSGIEEIGRNLDVAGCHLMDPLGDRHRRPAPWRVGWPRGVTSWIPWRQLWRDWRRHIDWLAAYQMRTGHSKPHSSTHLRHIARQDVL